MHTVESAREIVLRESRRGPTSAVPLSNALGAVLADAMRADADSPPFDKALVDGFAVRAQDCETAGARLRVVEQVLAGQSPSVRVGVGDCTAIATGAPLPTGADAVVMHEQTRVEPDGTVVLEIPARSGQNRLERGREYRNGDELVPAGTRLNPVHLGLLASVGATAFAVVGRPTVAIVPTGDELVEPDHAPGPGQIRNSNATLLEALARRDGCPTRAFGIVADEPARLAQVLREGLASDVLLVSGGVSAGPRDLVPGTLESLGVRVHFHKVRLKPGKPLLFGSIEAGPDRPRRALVFGLPGNPVSGLVGYLLFVRPALRVLSGLSEPTSTYPTYPLMEAYDARGDRPIAHPCRLVDVGSSTQLATLPWAGSADLRAVAAADGFAFFEAGDRHYPAGSAVSYIALD